MEKQSQRWSKGTVQLITPPLSSLAAANPAFSLLSGSQWILLCFIHVAGMYSLILLNIIHTKDAGWTHYAVICLSWPEWKPDKNAAAGNVFLDSAILMMMKADTVSTSSAHQRQTFARPFLFSSLRGRFLKPRFFSAAKMPSSKKSEKCLTQNLSDICNLLLWLQTTNLEVSSAAW